MYLDAYRIDDSAFARYIKNSSHECQLSIPPKQIIMPSGNAIDFVPADLDPAADLKDLEANKGETEHVEHASVKNEEGDLGFAISEDNSKPRTGLRRLLRRNPSAEFLREVAEANEHELDPVEVKKVSFQVIFPSTCT